MKVYIKNEDEVVGMETAEFSTYVIEKLSDLGTEVPSYDDDTPAATVVEHFTKMIVAGQEEPDWSSMQIEDTVPFEDTFKFIDDLVGGGKSEKNKEELEKAVAEAKLAKKEQKEVEEKKVEERRLSFAEATQAGVKRANEDFKAELESMSESLPEGVTLARGAHGGIQLQLEEGSDEKSLAEALSYFVVKGENSDFVKGQVQFLAGDAALIAVEQGIYKDVKQAGEYLSEALDKSIGYKIGARHIETYARMSKRVPIEDRNPRVQPTAYLAVANAPSPKKVKGQTEDDYKKVVSDHNEERAKLIHCLGEGKIVAKVDGKKVEMDLKERKDVLPLVKNMQIKHGVAREEDPNAKTTGDWLNQFYMATSALEYLLGVVEDETVIYKLGKGQSHSSEEEVELETGTKIKIAKLTEADLNTLIEEAKNNLENIKYNQQGVTFKEFIEGCRTIEVEEKVATEDGKMVVKRDPISKKPIVRDVTVPCYPEWPFKN